MTDSDDLESQLGSGGEVAESLFRFLLDPSEGPAPGTSEPAPELRNLHLELRNLRPELRNLPDFSRKRVPKMEPKATCYFRHYFPMTLGSVFLAFSIFLASFLGCWGSRWSYTRYYKAHASSNAPVPTAHYHQKIQGSAAWGVSHWNLVGNWSWIWGNLQKHIFGPAQQ